jgi:hypothetical protein
MKMINLYLVRYQIIDKLTKENESFDVTVSLDIDKSLDYDGKHIENINKVKSICEDYLSLIYDVNKKQFKPESCFDVLKYIETTDISQTDLKNLSLEERLKSASDTNLYEAKLISQTYNLRITECLTGYLYFEKPTKSWCYKRFDRINTALLNLVFKNKKLKVFYFTNKGMNRASNIREVIYDKLERLYFITNIDFAFNTLQNGEEITKSNEFLNSDANNRNVFIIDDELPISKYFEFRNLIYKKDYSDLFVIDDKNQLYEINKFASDLSFKGVN